MAWNLSTGAKLALLARQPAVAANKIASTISFGDGDGTGGTDTINDSGSGLAAVFAVHDFILVVGGTNNGVMVKALTVAAGKIEVIAGAFSTDSAGSPICLVKITSGSVAEVFKNSQMDVYSSTRPTNADLTETGTKLLALTKGGSAFTAGASLNGLNLGEFSSTTLKRAIDPETGVAEVWRGAGISPGGTAGWVRWYDNAKVTGASTTAIRMDGVVSTSGADLNLSTGLTIVTDVYSEVSDVNMTMSGV